MWLLIGLIDGLVATAGFGYAAIAIGYLDPPYQPWSTLWAVVLFALLSLAPLASFAHAWRTNRRAWAFAWIPAFVAAQLVIERVSGHAP